MSHIDIQIRFLDSAEDAKVCARMMAESEPWISLERGYRESLEILTEPFREVYIARLCEEIVGFIAVEMIGTFKGYIKSVCVAPEFRCQRIGSTLMNHAEERVFSETPNVFLLVSDFNTGARKLYKRLGYDEIGEFKDFITRGHSEVLMRKSIGPLTKFMV
jgi:ribosomal protein S18 acetylase RimI-like enzyme